MCAAEGYDIHTVAKLMGQANMSLTYSTRMHLFPASRRSASARVSCTAT